MQRLSGIDSMFVSLESPTNMFQVGAITVLDPATAPPGTPPPHEALRRVLEHRMDRLGPFHRRLVQVPGGIDHPRFVECPPELERHVRSGALPAPGSERELARYAADVLSRPLDRRRPLWEIHVVEGLEGGLVAGVAKIHHSAIDGIAGTEVTAQLMDLEPTPVPDGPCPSLPLEHGPDLVSLLRDAVSAAGSRVLPASRLAARLATGALMLRSRNRQLPHGAPPALFSAPRTRFGVRLGPDRAVGLARVDRSDVDLVRQVAGATVNDVILHLAGSALRRYLEDIGELPGEPLIAFVPKSVRGELDTLETGVNRLSGMLVSLATDVADPLGRLVVVAESARAAKEQERLLGEDLLSELAELGIPGLLSVGGRMMRGLRLLERRPPFNVVVSSFPGPPFPLYCGGAELLAYHPFGPVVDGAAVNVTAMSYRDHISFGVLACRDAVPDAESLGQLIPEAMTELAKAADAAHRIRPWG
jgi:WS/DGAT/MGAT family acyltransferase